MPHPTTLPRWAFLRSIHRDIGIFILLTSISNGSSMADDAKLQLFLIYIIRMWPLRGLLGYNFLVDEARNLFGFSFAMRAIYFHFDRSTLWSFHRSAISPSEARHLAAACLRLLDSRQL